MTPTIPRVLPLRDDIRTRRFPAVTAAIIAVNTAVWLGFELHDVQRGVRELGLYPCAVTGSCPAYEGMWPLSVLTSMFAHMSWLHIGGNMLFLWIFGNNVEDALGRVAYALFYLSAGLVATASQLFVTLAFGTAQDARIPNLGASGAIAGVLGAYLVLYPRARVRSAVFVFLFVSLVDVPAVAFLGAWFALQLWAGGYDLISPPHGGGVAFFAHIGGFTFGALAAWALARRWRPDRATEWRVAAPGWR